MSVPWRTGFGFSKFQNNVEKHSKTYSVPFPEKEQVISQREAGVEGAGSHRMEWEGL